MIHMHKEIKKKNFRSYGNSSEKFNALIEEKFQKLVKARK